MALEERTNDLENGSAVQDGRHNLDSSEDENDLSEYGALVKYISTYRDNRRKSVSSEASEEESAQRRWYAPWRAGTPRSKKDGQSDDFEVPQYWLNTEMRHGLTSTEVENRRKKTGWNELTSEKENMFLKFLMYFTGPILYGQ
jgi:H+-transporting ATPase